MGNVFKAYDPTLKRYVALKILRRDDPEETKRFLREARAQAQVEHVHVCKVYESGEFEGNPYIAMQYIEGQNLGQLGDSLTLEEKLQIMKDVALGIHAAHRQGLIHRDVKPANVMIDQTEEGQWKPYVMDFGIAREQEASDFRLVGKASKAGADEVSDNVRARSAVMRVLERTDIRKNSQGSA